MRANIINRGYKIKDNNIQTTKTTGTFLFILPSNYYVEERIKTSPLIIYINLMIFIFHLFEGRQKAEAIHL